MASFPLVSVEWSDAHSVSGTTAMSLHEIPHAAIAVTTYGLLLRQDEIGVTVANEVCADGTYRGITFVPASLLLRVEVVRGGKKVRKPKAQLVGSEGSSSPVQRISPSALTS